METNTEKGRPPPQWLILAASALMMAFCLGFGIKGLDFPMGVTAFLALSLLFFAYLDQFTEFTASATGITAKTRQIVQEARNTLDELKGLATVVAKVQISLLARQGRIGGYDQKAQELLREEIFSILDRIGVPPSAHEDILADVRRLDQHDYVHEILGGHTVPVNIGVHIHAWNAFRQRALSNPPTPEELTKFLTEASLITDDKKELIEDYRFYQEKKRHRRPDAWLKMHSSGF